MKLHTDNLTADSIRSYAIDELERNGWPSVAGDVRDGLPYETVAGRVRSVVFDADEAEVPLAILAEAEIAQDRLDASAPSARCPFEDGHEDDRTDTFTLTVELGNDAMQSREDVADALRGAAARLTALGETEAWIRDVNGNTVGSWSLRVVCDD